MKEIRRALEIQWAWYESLSPSDKLLGPGKIAKTTCRNCHSPPSTIALLDTFLQKNMSKGEESESGGPVKKEGGNDGTT